MRIGVPKEIKVHEYRVGLVPSSIHELVYYGHEVLVEKGAGGEAGIPDEAYKEVGARIAGTADEVVEAARAHAVAAHGHSDSPELVSMLRVSLKPEVAS